MQFVKSILIVRISDKGIDMRINFAEFDHLILCSKSLTFRLTYLGFCRTMVGIMEMLWHVPS